MTRITTNYTTHDLAYYYADLKRLPRLSPEGRQHLLVTLAQVAAVAPQDHTRLIEDHLNLATHIVIDRCPPAYYRVLPDILGEMALSLVSLTHRYDFGAGNDYTSAVVACADYSIKRAIGKERLIRVPSSTLSKAKQHGTEQHLYALQPESLDRLMIWYDTSELEEPPTSPLLPTQEAPPRDPVLRAQVQT
ncbi:MAG TPA: hypothetical protein VKY19_17140 [Ktedonosporobacter sp.]|jgi:hypothetical protein|nr:hypothetical protein [Ktedonosporobacter sp.]